MRTVKNTTIATLSHTLSGYQFGSNVEVEITYVDSLNMQDAQMTDWILDGSIVVIKDTLELSPVIGESYFSSNSVSLSSSVAIDKDATDQSISDVNWILVTADRIIWDIDEDYDATTDDFVVPIDGVYKFDCKLRIVDIVNCDQIELAVFKRGSPDDYWFIVDRQYPNDMGLSELILSGAITFDMYKDEHYCLKIKMTKVDSGSAVTATIDGDDDYTAWGFDLSKRF